MTLNQLEYYCAVCRFQSITRASEELYVSQPTISVAVRELEKEFHMQFFNHNKNRISLTSDGEAFYLKASKLLEQARGMYDEFARLGEQTRPIKIGIPPIMSTVFFPRMIDAFHEKSHTPVQLQEYGSVRACDLVASGDLDLALVNMDVYGLDRFENFEIMTAECVYCVSRTHRYAGESEITFDMLKDENLILFNTDSVLNQTVYARFRSMKATPRILMTSSQLYTILNFVRSGTCGAFLFSPIAVNPRDFVTLPIRPVMTNRFGLVWKKGPIRKQAETFIDFAKGYDITPYL